MVTGPLGQEQWPLPPSSASVSPWVGKGRRTELQSATSTGLVNSGQWLRPKQLSLRRQAWRLPASEGDVSSLSSFQFFSSPLGKERPRRQRVQCVSSAMIIGYPYCGEWGPGHCNRVLPSPDTGLIHTRLPLPSTSGSEPGWAGPGL